MECRYDTGYIFIIVNIIDIGKKKSFIGYLIVVVPLAGTVVTHIFETTVKLKETYNILTRVDEIRKINSSNCIQKKVQSPQNSIEYKKFIKSIHLSSKSM